MRNGQTIQWISTRKKNKSHIIANTKSNLKIHLKKKHKKEFLKILRVDNIDYIISGSYKFLKTLQAFTRKENVYKSDYIKIKILHMKKYTFNQVTCQATEQQKNLQYI